MECMEIWKEFAIKLVHIQDMSLMKQARDSKTDVARRSNRSHAIRHIRRPSSVKKKGDIEVTVCCTRLPVDQEKMEPESSSTLGHGMMGADSVGSGAFVSGVPLNHGESSGGVNSALLHEREVVRSAGRAAISSFLDSHECFSVLRNSGKVVVFDTRIPIQLAFYALVEHGEWIPNLTT
eukprot:scaffold7912_cov49-Attheya_sp.AAC.3